MFTILYVLASSLLVAVISLLCAVFLCVSDEKLKIWMPRLIAVAVGVLLGDAFSHLLPDALEVAGTMDRTVGLSILVGILTFFFIETVLQWHHDHSLESNTPVQKTPASFATHLFFANLRPIKISFVGNSLRYDLISLISDSENSLFIVNVPFLDMKNVKNCKIIKTC